jgi:hypothetical protein
MTVHLVAAHAMLDDTMATPEGAAALHLVSQGLRNGDWDDGLGYVDAIGQLGNRSHSSWPMEQIAAFAAVHGMIHTGAVAMVPVATRGTPRPDKDREANAGALSSLPHPFTAAVDMDQRTAECDGMVYWSEPIEVSVATEIIEDDRPLSLHYMLPPGSAPLEIGSSQPSRTWLHLVLDGGAVARWPYGHSCFRLLINLAYMTEKLSPLPSIDPAPRKRKTAVAVAERKPIPGALTGAALLSAIQGSLW